MRVCGAINNKRGGRQTRRRVQLQWGRLLYSSHRKNLAIDATKEFTRIGRLVNHAAKNANVRLHNPVKINGVKRVALVALWDIKENEELFYDYGIQ